MGLTTGESISIQVVSLTEFFRTSLHDIAEKQKLTLAAHTEHYVVNLLIGFTKAEALFDTNAQGGKTRPLLALLLAQALEAPSALARERGFQRLGDVALFSVGFFAHGFARKLVDVDYYASMGGNAYSVLGDNARSPGLNQIRPVFQELAAKFIPIMDALNELSDQARGANVDDLLRFYEIWLKTGSQRAHDKLCQAGLDPVVSKGSLSSH